MTTTSIDTENHAEITRGAKAILNGQRDGNTLQAQPENKGKPESELRAAARRHGYTLKDLAALMGASYSHLCSVANGHRPWTPDLREKVKAVLAEVPGQGVVYRQGGKVTSESSFIRERAREMGLTLKDLAVAVGVSYRYMTQAARGQRNMSPSMQVRVESALGSPVEIAPRRVRQPAGVHRKRRQQLPAGTGPGNGPEHGGTGGHGGGESRIHVRRGPGPPEPEPPDAGAGGESPRGSRQG